MLTFSFHVPVFRSGNILLIGFYSSLETQVHSSVASFNVFQSHKCKLVLKVITGGCSCLAGSSPAHWRAIDKPRSQSEDAGVARLGIRSPN